MGWLWGSSDDGDSKKDDPLGKLDPALKKFLEKESPIKYNSSNPPPPPPSAPTASEFPPSYTDRVTSGSRTLSDQSNPSSAERPNAPPPSLYPDGRYADLWKSYRPLAELESEGKSDQEKLLDVLEGYKYRKAEIGRAALENCALEQWAVNDCFQSGSWSSIMTLCRAENRSLERCYLMQAKFLKALGYLSTFDRPPEVDEKIQMHADKLYHQMLDQEAAIEKAKAEGLPVPNFESLFRSSSSQPPDVRAPTSTLPTGVSKQTESVVARAPTTIDELKPEVRAKLKKQLEDLPPEEREIEETAIAAEIAAGERLGRKLGDLYSEREEARKRRREEGQQSLGDVVARWFRSK
ncbi:MAG: hypothetical protein M1837_005980 [Sclerophora amabilis]|nr:MAG: hypothetical protein M1837_005980 [Sclerophora amabilis]